MPRNRYGATGRRHAGAARGAECALHQYRRSAGTTRQRPNSHRGRAAPGCRGPPRAAKPRGIQDRQRPSASLSWLNATSDGPVDSNRSNVLGDDQHVDLSEQQFEPLLEFFEKLLRPAVRPGDDFDLDNVFDKIDAAIVPSPLIGRGLGTHRSRAENIDELLANARNFLPFDFRPVVVLQRQINLVFFHTFPAIFARLYR